jgi:hypothetical protein
VVAVHILGLIDDLVVLAVPHFSLDYPLNKCIEAESSVSVKTVSVYNLAVIKLKQLHGVWLYEEYTPLLSKTV